MNIIAVGDFALLVPKLNAQVGKEFTIVNVKDKQIVGKIKVLNAPKDLLFTEKYTKKEVLKIGTNKKR